MRLTLERLYQARWSADVHTEWIRAVLRDHAHIPPARLSDLRDAMDTRAQDAVVTGYESLTMSLTLPDPNDSSRPGWQNLMSDESITMKTKHDWTAADALTDEQIHAAAVADPDAQPLTPERVAGMKQTPRFKIIRRALGLTQEEFAQRFQIPLGTLRDWEQGASQPDQTARAYLRAIAGDADAVQHALETAAPHPL